MKTLVAGALLALCACAQSPTEPAALVRVIRIRPSQADDAIRHYSSEKISTTVPGLAAVTGWPESGLLEMHDSFGALQEVDTAVRPALARIGAAEQNEALGSSTYLLGFYRPGLSYRPEQAVIGMRKSRYMRVSVNRIHEAAEAAKSGITSAVLDQPTIAYQVVSGTREGMYLFLTPIESLRIIDNLITRFPRWADAKVGDADSDRVTLLFRVDPGISYVSGEFAETDPDFWHGVSGRP